MSHYREVCEDCERVIRQCRCPGGTTTRLPATECWHCAEAKRTEEASKADPVGQVPVLQCDETGDHVVQASGVGVHEVRVDREDSSEDPYWRGVVRDEGIVSALELVAARIGLLEKHIEETGWDEHARLTKNLVHSIQIALGN